MSNSLVGLQKCPRCSKEELELKVAGRTLRQSIGCHTVYEKWEYQWYCRSCRWHLRGGELDRQEEVAKKCRHCNRPTMVKAIEWGY